MGWDTLRDSMEGGTRDEGGRSEEGGSYNSPV